MEVILLEQVGKLGKIGDVVQVKAGYARNYLIPRSKALYATAANKAGFEAQKTDLEKENAHKLEIANELGAKINGTVVVLIRQAGEDGRLFGSVRAVDIAEAVQKSTDEVISRQMIILSTPIKQIGVYPVIVSLHPEVKVKVKVNVARSEDEAQAAQKELDKEAIGSSENNSQN